jgi:hypothetical protein
MRRFNGGHVLIGVKAEGDEIAECPDAFASPR